MARGIKITGNKKVVPKIDPIDQAWELLVRYCGGSNKVTYLKIKQFNTEWEMNLTLDQRNELFNRTFLNKYTN
jgi:hypothetical protein